VLAAPRGLAEQPPAAPEETRAKWEAASPHASSLSNCEILDALRCFIPRRLPTRYNRNAARGKDPAPCRLCRNSPLAASLAALPHGLVAAAFSSTLDVLSSPWSSAAAEHAPSNEDTNSRGFSFGGFMTASNLNYSSWSSMCSRAQTMMIASASIPSSAAHQCLIHEPCTPCAQWFAYAAVSITDQIIMFRFAAEARMKVSIYATDKEI